MNPSAQQRLENRDYVIMIDKSGSMSGKASPSSNKTRWQAARETTEALARKVEAFDKDGIKVVVFGSTHKVYDNVTADKVSQIFEENEPSGSTNLHTPLEAVFKDYTSRKSSGKTQENGELCLVVTDGQPDDENAVAKAIVNFGNKLDNADAEYGISFLQVGNDASASAYLKRLDDDLTSQGAKHDIVDAKTFDEIETIGLTETLIAALDD